MFRLTAKNKQRQVQKQILRCAKDDKVGGRAKDDRVGSKAKDNSFHGVS